METFVSRYEQIKELREFVRAKVFESSHYNRQTDLIMITGDFNQNAAPMNHLQKEYYDLIAAEPKYRPIL